MNDLQRALDDIADVRQTVSYGMVFRGFAPAVLACTGLAALALAAIQFGRPSPPGLTAFFGPWIGLAVAAVMLIGIDIFSWAERNQSALARSMAFSIAEKFIPSGLAGAAIAAVIWNAAPEASWALPGLWQMLISLGVFASVRVLPRNAYFVAVWYLAAGTATLLLGAQTRTVSPFMMGAPFGAGQIVLAVVFWKAFRGQNDKI